MLEFKLAKAKKIIIFCVIFIQDLSMKGMNQALILDKNVPDNGCRNFITIFNYKTKLRKKQLVKIEKSYPLNKTCSVCNLVKEELKVSDKICTCQ